jgi:hypothetical protein
VLGATILVLKVPLAKCGEPTSRLRPHRTADLRARARVVMINA